MNASRRIGMIGYGAIAKVLLDTLARHHKDIEVIGIVRRKDGGSAPGPYRFHTDIGAVLALKPDLVIECAGHEALRTLGPAVLAAGTDLLVASTGALADRDTEAALRAAAAQTAARVILVAGAVGGLDALSAARQCGLEQVRYTGRKPPQAWRGTAAEKMVDLNGITGSAAIVFEGSAREAALRFPQNANVAAAIALAGIGFDNTRVTLLADPDAAGNLHCIEAQGAFGRFRIELEGIALQDNPKTSRLTVGSLAAALSDRRQSIVFA
jgi:aspartate dehydrogenase